MLIQRQKKELKEELRNHKKMDGKLFQWFTLMGSL